MQQTSPTHALGTYRDPAAEGMSAASLGDHVESLLRWQILSGDVVGGEKVKEQVIARQLDVSRATVRDATRRLYGAGLVEIDSQRGVFVKTFTLPQIEDIIEIRRVLCDLTASLYIERATEHDRGQITDLFNKVSEVEKQPFAEEHYILGLLFNEAVVRATHNERLFTLYHEAWQQIRIFKLFLRHQIDGRIDIHRHNQEMFAQGAEFRSELFQALIEKNHAGIGGAMRRAAAQSLVGARALFSDYEAATRSSWRERIKATSTT